MGRDRYWLLHTSQKVSVTAPLHIATIISISTIGMRLLKIRNCFVIVAIPVRESSKIRGPIMLRQLVTLLHLSLSDIVTSGEFATAFSTGGSIPYLHLFDGPDVLTTSTDKANHVARNSSCNSTLDDGYQQLPDFRTEQRLSTAKMVSRSCNLRSWCIQSHWSRQNSSHCP